MCENFFRFNNHSQRPVELSWRMKLINIDFHNFNSKSCEESLPLPRQEVEVDLRLGVRSLCVTAVVGSDWWSRHLDMLRERVLHRAGVAGTAGSSGSESPSSG